MEQFTNLYQVSKTLRFELKPIGKTQKTFKQWLEKLKSTELVADKDDNLFAKDEKIKKAYLAIKPIMDKQHEQFIEISLTSEKAKGIDFSQYFKAYQEKNISDKLENGLREQIRDTYDVAGKYFSEKIEEAIKNLKKKSLRVMAKRVRKNKKMKSLIIQKRKKHTNASQRRRCIITYRLM